MIQGRPVIGVTPSFSTSTGEIFLRRRYLDSILEAGGIPILIPPAGEEVVNGLLMRLEGVLLTGGVDVDPAFYGEKPMPELGDVQPARDRLEIALVRAAWRLNLPVLGICRGSQVINVALGGTLWQDIPADLKIPDARHRQKEDFEVRTHLVRTAPDSFLAALAGPAPFSVNSRHHQAVRILAPRLRAAAWCVEDEVLEGFEAQKAEGKRFFAGVQWHPEMLRDQHSAALFKAFVAACR